MSQELEELMVPDSSIPTHPPHLEGDSWSSGYQTAEDEGKMAAANSNTCSSPAESVEPPATSIPTLRKLAYGVGHVFNDLCASMWFTYMVLFFHKVVQLDSTYAGILILVGQVADGVATPIIGFLCDRVHLRYGRRKFFHLVGTVVVGVFLFYFWHTCLPCKDDTPLAAMMVYFSVPIIVFQFGWAAVQISHLSLIPDLTEDKNERVSLNAVRYSFTILSNLSVYMAMILLLFFIHNPEHGRPKLPSTSTWKYHTQAFSNFTCPEEELDGIGPHDVWIFSGTALGIIVVGGTFSFIFHVGTHEPYIPPEEMKMQHSEERKIKWYLWFRNPQFYPVAAIYMSTRLINNMIQAYTPLYLTESLELSKASVAIGPLVIYISGFFTSLLLKGLNRIIGRYMVYFLGIASIWGGLIWFQLMDPPHNNVGLNVVVYGSTILVGVGGATILVTSLSMVADLIGSTTGSAAFVYGLMSFTDKLSSGVAIQIIQALHPCQNQSGSCCAEKWYYRQVLVTVPGAASGLAVVALGLLVLLMHCMNRRLKQKKKIAKSTGSSGDHHSGSRDAAPIAMHMSTGVPNGCTTEEKRSLLTH